MDKARARKITLAAVLCVGALARLMPGATALAASQAPALVSSCHVTFAERAARGSSSDYFAWSYAARAKNATPYWISATIMFFGLTHGAREVVAGAPVVLQARPYALSEEQDPVRVELLSSNATPDSSRFATHSFSCALLAVTERVCDAHCAHITSRGQVFGETSPERDRYVNWINPSAVRRALLDAGTNANQACVIPWNIVQRDLASYFVQLTEAGCFEGPR